jgi:pimeloyl-ACP methyl ester carboxylesterase
MPHARVAGLDLYYEDHGSGPRTVVMAHGALASISFLEQHGLTASALAARGLRVIAYDARGHGRSGYSTAARDYDQHMLAEELHQLLDVLGLGRVTVCGTSMGSTSAVLFAQAHPARVERLVLRVPAPLGADMIPVRRMFNTLAWSYQLLGASLTARIGALRPHPDGAARMRALLQGQRPAAIAPALRGFLAAPLDTGQVHGIKAPTLILTQPSDDVHPLRSGEVLYDLLPNAALCIAPTPTLWDGDIDQLADLIAAFVVGNDDVVKQMAEARGCTVRRKTRGD